MGDPKKPFSRLKTRYKITKCCRFLVPILFTQDVQVMWAYLYCNHRLLVRYYSSCGPVLCVVTCVPVCEGLVCVFHQFTWWYILWYHDTIFKYIKGILGIKYINREEEKVGLSQKLELLTKWCSNLLCFYYSASCMLAM